MAKTFSFPTKGSTVLAKWNLERQAARQRADVAKFVHRPTRRAFEAGQQTRLTTFWSNGNTGINQDLEMQLGSLRGRCRTLAQNNEYARKFLQMVGTHIVGPDGFRLSVNGTNGYGAEAKPDEVGNQVIERHFNDWCLAQNCDVAGRLAFPAMCRLIVTTVARDGEAIIRRVRGAKAGKYGYQLQVLDIDRLAISYSGRTKANNQIRMGVEYDSMGRVVAYHLAGRNPSDYNALQDKVTTERVLADDMFHLYVTERAEQLRGVPWMHAAGISLYQLGAFEEAAVIAARVGASKMGFFTAPESDGAPLAEGQDATTGQLYQDAEPGKFDVLPEGYSFTAFNPDYPHGNYEPFVKAALRRIASGLGVAYNTMSSDLEGVNFSSIRSAVLEERDNWTVLQNWFIDSFLVPVYQDWLFMALTFKAIKFSDAKVMPADRFDKFSMPRWQGRRWKWVDPVRDAEANLMLRRAGLKSSTTIADEQGLEFADELAKIAIDEAAAQKLKVAIDNGGGAPPPPTSPTNSLGAAN
jgi:lambda family phage portal protein